MIKKIFLLSSLMCLLTSLLAQNTIIKGSVTDESNAKIINAYVVLLLDSNVEMGTMTDINGEYQIRKIPKGIYNLQCGFVGYRKVMIKNIKIDNDTIIDIDIVLEVAQLESVVINSYSKTKKRKSAKATHYLPSTAQINSYESSYSYHNTESYDRIYEQGFRTTTKNPLSTFSVDVDNASYSNVRRFIYQSRKPPKDAVRIEELLNYFDYDYPQPTDRHPFSVNLESGECPWNTKHKLIKIGIKGEDLSKQQIPASNLVFLIDVSGSMGDYNKLPLLKKSLKILVNNLSEKDKISIVVYAGKSAVLLNSISVDEKNEEKILSAIDQLYAEGATAGGSALKMAYKIASNNLIKGGNNRIILATDGDFNVGISDNASLVRFIEAQRETGIYLTILGFGMYNYKDAKMEQLSNAGNGNYFYIDNILEAKKVFENQLNSNLYTIAKDVKIQIEFNPAYVKAYRLIGYENRALENKDFNDDTKDAGEIGSGHTVTAFYEIIPADSKEKINETDDLKYQKTREVVDSEEVFTVKFRYKPLDSDKSILISKSITIDEFEKFNASPDFMFATAVVEFGLLLRDSEHKANASFNALIKRAKKYQGKDFYNYRSEFIKIAEMAKILD